jgi:dTDP-4-dehydrorhamnose reductase
MGDTHTVNVLVTGATGLLGGWVVDELCRSGDNAVACGGPKRAGDAVVALDLDDPAGVDALFARVRPDAVIHGAALSAVADCAADPARARRINVDGTAQLAQAARRVGATLVHVSTDMVFDGERAPYDEGAPVGPLSVYGATKVEAEKAALEHGGVVVRVSLLFGPTKTGRRGFFEQMRGGGSLRLFDDEWRTPLSLRAAAEGLVAIARADVRGTLHLGGPERLSRYEMGTRLAPVLGADVVLTRASRTAASGAEPRPRDLSLDSTLFRARFPGIATRPYEEECRRMLNEA